MQNNFVSFVFLSFVFFIDLNSTKIEIAEAKICTKLTSYAVTVTKNQPYVKAVTARRWNGQRYIIWQNNTRTVTQIEWRTKTIDTCCDGYTRYRSKCIPLCDEVCENSKCTEPNVCTCNEGYVKFTNFRCVPYCENCKFGSCIAPNYCECFSNYEKDLNGTCQPKCINACVNGYCANPDFCMCYEGYKVSANAVHICEPICESECTNGRCVKPNECECFEGYEKNHEDQCVPICENCENGDCIAPKHCVCRNDYTKVNETCTPVCIPPCQGGKCIAPNQCKCFSGYKPKENKIKSDICEHVVAPNCTKSQDISELHDSICVPICVNCENGECVSPGECICHEGYEMNNEGHCEPICDPECINSKCIAPNQCECNEGYKKLEDSNHVCQSECENCECDGSGDEFCSYTTESETENYPDELYKFDVSTKNSYNCLESDDCPDDSYCIDFKCVCEIGLILDDDSDACVPRSCEQNCENGKCNNEDECVCDEGYVFNGTECILILNNNNTPTIDKDCINGFYNESNICECYEGYTLLNNETMYQNYCIPLCNNVENGCINGTCTKPDICECDQGFELSSINKFLCTESKRNENDAKRIMKSSSSNLWILLLSIFISALVISSIVLLAYKRIYRGKDYNVKKRENFSGVVSFSKSSEDEKNHVI